MNADSTTIHPFPELRAYAESEARAAWASLGIVVARHIGVPATTFDGCPDPNVTDAWIEAHLTLLCDLSRPASRDAVARLVAAKIWWQPERVIGAIESSGSVRNRLYRKVGVGGWCNSAPKALALIVRHLWPPESTDAR